jgi:hypothetical protein
MISSRAFFWASDFFRGYEEDAVRKKKHRYAVEEIMYLDGVTYSLIFLPSGLFFVEQYSA